MNVYVPANNKVCFVNVIVAFKKYVNLQFFFYIYTPQAHFRHNKNIIQVTFSSIS